MEFILIAGSLFLLGAAHALEPGHGKLLVTSYLTGSEARHRDAVILGLLVAIFHTLSVSILGLAITALALTFFKHTAINALEVISGVVVLSLGVLLFWRRFIQKGDHEDQCDCHVSHAGHPSEEVKLRPKSTLKEVIMLAFASGITPCPMALIALVGAFQLGELSLGFAALAIFSLGIGAVLVILGMALIHGADNLKSRWKRFEHAPVMIARFSTVLVLLLGCYLVSKSFLFPEDPHAHQNDANMLMLLMEDIRKH